MVIMKTVLLLSVLLFAAFAAPSEDKVVSEAAMMEPKEDLAATAEVELQLKSKDKVLVPEVSRNGLVSEDAAAAESRFNFCPNGWFPYNSRCFKFVNTPMNWYNAEEHCNSLGAHLASVTSPREYSFLQQMTQMASQSQAWLGGFNLQGRWMWIDRQGFYFINSYSPASPSSFPCIYLRSSNGWGNTQCGSALRFICSVNPFSC